VESKKKYLLLLILMLLGLYPIAELTQLILVSGVYYYPELKGQFVGEIVVMWALYAAVIPVFLGFAGQNARRFRKPFIAGPELRYKEPTATPRDGGQEHIPVRFIR
jgi:hypothetical protein